MTRSIAFLLLLVFAATNGACVENAKAKEKQKENPENLPKRISAADRHPVLISRDFGESWEASSSGLPQNLQVSFMELKGEEIVLASDNKGIYISGNQRSSWRSIADELPNPKINALAVQGEIIYAGVYRQGIYWSNDEGENWESLNFDLPNLNIQSILFFEQKLFVGTDQGIFYRESEQKNWIGTQLKAQVLSMYAYEGKLIAGSSQGTALSLDGGENWKWIRQEGAVHYTHNIGERIIELALNGDLVYSDDWGESWQNTNYEPRYGSYIYEITRVKDYQLFSNNYGLHRSKDAGKNWNLIFKTENLAFFDLIMIGDELYGGTRSWDEFRARSK